MKVPEKKSGAGQLFRDVWRDRVSYLFLLPYASMFILFTVLPVVTSMFYSFTYNNYFEPLRLWGWIIIYGCLQAMRCFPRRCRTRWYLR